MIMMRRVSTLRIICKHNQRSAAAAAAAPLLAIQRGSNELLTRSSFRHFTSNSDYDEFLSQTSLARKPSAIRSLQPLVNLPGMISLGGGMPNAKTFPFEKLTMQCNGGIELALEGKSLEEALQYSATPGLPALNKFLFDLQLDEHNMAPESSTGIERSLTITQGSQDGLSKVFDMLLDSNDALLVESPTYSGSLAYLQPKGCKLVELECDEGGLVPDKLESILKDWDPVREGCPRPKVLYTIPTGSNPTGASLSLERKKAIYEIAAKYNLLILEDDPYYYLRLDEGDRSQQPSFLELDTDDSRVLRFDSFSKILSSGMRIGFVTGPTPLIDRINLHTQASNLHPAGITQAMVLGLLQSWGKEGWENHLANVCAFYRIQRDHFLDSASKHLTGLVEWNKPTAGMFVWMKLLGVDDTQELIETKAIESKVLLVPGSVFLPNPRPSQYVRAAYSTASPQDMDTALQRLANLLKE